MNKQVNSGTDAGPSELSEMHFHTTSSNESKGQVTTESEQTANIRGFAEHIVRQLCERHSHDMQESAKTISDDSTHRPAP